MRCVFLAFVLFICQSQIPTSKTGSKVSDADAKTALDFHNKARREVGVPELEWSKELASFAQEWADHLAAQDCTMKHRPESGEWSQRYGENIFWGSDVYTVLDACEAWYGEKKDFTGPVFTGHETNVVGHYTQMVWRNCKKVGIGIGTCKNGAIIIVANYDPRGNYMGGNAY